MAQSWAELPTCRVVWACGVSSAVVMSRTGALPEGSPAIFSYLAGGGRTVAETVADVLHELERNVVDLFPAWLPGAEGIDGPGGAAVPAVRELARRAASGHRHLAPFLMDLAARSLTGAVPRGHPGMTEVRAAGLALAFAASLGRPRTSILVQVPEGLSAAEEETLVAAGEWLVQRGGLGVWLTGAALVTVDRIQTVTVRSEPLRHVSVSSATAGLPHPFSPVESALERALSSHGWAAGRAWNQTYQPHPLVNPIRVDLCWPDERCVVELDGPEHRRPGRLADDLARDARLGRDGYAVLRFTNERVMADMPAVLRELKQFLQTHRTREGQGYAGNRTHTLRDSGAGGVDGRGE
ncbi:endonuclease domain-containing protein [Streptosporangium amethystogenes subsp. fukuiense]|uniref:Endonuclease domain-containing protein n=1 Tax=Streptosporangium amethystogenes subsp. fukuiense TaxID=698418 RepID=A0ABW2TAK8_9ACTN